MRIFISWSGALSRSIALELYEWLPMVHQRLDPYMSSESIDKGVRWSSDVGKELENAKFGLLVLTPDNLESPWIHFEAGAIAKTVEESKLAPLIFGLKPSDVKAPLSQFQVTVFEKGDMGKLLKSINVSAGDEALPEQRLERIFDVVWNQINDKITPMLASSIKDKAPKPEKVE